MSTIQETPAPAAPSDLPPSDLAPTGRPAPGRGRWTALAVAAAVVAAGGGAALAMRGGDELPPPTQGSALNPTAPITLPATVLGLHPLPATADPTRTATWQAKARTAGTGAVVVGRSYGGTTPGSRTVRVVVGRTDLTGKLEQAWAAGPGEVVGAARCTNNTVIVKDGKPRVRPTLMVCWRTSAALSAYSLIIDPKAKTPVTAADGAAALDAGWRAAQQTG